MSKNKPEIRSEIHVGLAGLGTVGTALLAHMDAHGAEMSARAGADVKIVAVSARERTKSRGIDLAPYEWIDDARVLAARDDIDIIVETIGGEGGIALRVVETALSRGAHVATANKALMAAQGARLAGLAEKNKSALLFEAAVAGSVPIVKTLSDIAAGASVSSVDGILNGTCNYILCGMEETGRALDDILKDAQREGYAEADPSFDLDGIDAAQKLALLASLAFGVAPGLSRVLCEGIRALTPLDMRLARAMGYAVRLCAHADATRQWVRPVLVPARHRLAHVLGTMNAVILRGAGFGSLLLEGEGAGGAPTAAALASDIAQIACGQMPRYPLGRPVAALTKTAPASDAEAGAYYIRVLARDEAGSMAAIAATMAEAGISLAGLHQPTDMKDIASAAGKRPVAMETHRTDAARIAKALKALGAHDAVASAPIALLVLDQGSDADKR